MEALSDGLLCELGFRFQSAFDPVSAPHKAMRVKNVGPLTI